MANYARSVRAAWHTRAKNYIQTIPIKATMNKLSPAPLITRVGAMEMPEALQNLPPKMKELWLELWADSESPSVGLKYKILKVVSDSNLSEPMLKILSNIKATTPVQKIIVWEAQFHLSKTPAYSSRTINKRVRSLSISSEAVDKALMQISKGMSIDARYRLVRQAIEHSESYQDYQNIILQLTQYPDLVTHVVTQVVDGRKEKETLLMVAARNNKPRILYYLLDKGANANIENHDGKTAIMLLNPKEKDFPKALRCMVSYADAYGHEKLDMAKITNTYFTPWRAHDRHQWLSKEEMDIWEKALDDTQRVRMEHQKASTLSPKTLQLPYSKIPRPEEMPPPYSKVPRASTAPSLSTLA
jgi:Ankyrin repeat